MMSIMAVQDFYQYTHSACRILVAALLILMTAISALAAPKPNGATANAPVFPGTLPNAQYV